MGAKRLWIVGLVIAQGCSRWVPAQLTPEPGSPEKVRVTLVDSSQVFVRYPFLTADSLLWLSNQRPDGSRIAPGDSLFRAGIPRSQIAAIQVQDNNTPSSAVLGVAGLGVVAALIVVTVKYFEGWEKNGGW